jgi:hypothetical protein
MEKGYQAIITNYIENLSILEAYINGLEDMLEYQSQKLVPSIEEGDLSLKPVFQAVSLMGLDMSTEEKLEKIRKFNEDFSHGSITYELGNESKGNFRVSFNDEIIAKRFERITNKVLVNIKQIPMIFTSSLISMVTYFELLVAKLIQERLMAHPEAMNIKQKTLTISQIEEIGSLEEAKNFLVEQEVNDLMHEGLKSWMEYFSNKMKINLGNLKDNIEEVNEVFSRRHLFVHNGGVVNNIYLTRVSKEYRGSLSVGDQITVNMEYFSNALKLFKKFGILLGLETWKRNTKDSKERDGFILNYVYELLIEDNWDLAASLCQFVMSDTNVTSSNRWVAQINYWLSQKRSGKFDSVVEEITDADLSALSAEYQLCRYALLHKVDSFFHLLEHAYPNPIGIQQLEEWPVFRDIRETPEYFDFVKEKSQNPVEI